MQKNKCQNMSFVGLVPVFLIILLLISPATSFEYMKNSLKLCVERLVPSLFPFMVISDFLISGNSGVILKKTLGKLIGLIFGTSEDGSFSVLLGFVCGFPIGAKSALKCFEENKISHGELCHIMSFCNIPSPAFVCGSVAVMFDSPRFGGILFISILLSSVLIGVVGRKVYSHDRKHSSALSPVTDISSAFTGAVTSSSVVMLCVCGYVVFFSTLIGYINILFQKMHVPAYLGILVSGIFEISNGMYSLSASGMKFLPAAAGFFTGFSGLSVIFQIFSLDTGGHIRKKAFVLQKLLHGVICSAIVSAAVKIFPVQINSSAPTLERVTFESYGLYICMLFFVSALLPILAQWKINKKHKSTHTKMVQLRDLRKTVNF